MRILPSFAAARMARSELGNRGGSLAFVPTMGALHEGHLALVTQAAELADRVWVSIFVNPTQFAPGEDLERYPRDLEADLDRLRPLGVDAVLAPQAAEVYGVPPETRISFPRLASQLCGASRPGHFEGVALIVSKLLHVVAPQVALFGQKDAQQVAVLKALVRDLDFGLRLQVGATVREADGLALSSRNAYLSVEQRAEATVLHDSLAELRACLLRGERSAGALEQWMRRRVEDTDGAQVDYAQVVDLSTLQPVERIEGPILAALAARFGSTRLIDNAALAPDGTPAPGWPEQQAGD